MSSSFEVPVKGEEKTKGQLPIDFSEIRSKLLAPGQIAAELLETSVFGSRLLTALARIPGLLRNTRYAFAFLVAAFLTWVGVEVFWVEERLPARAVVGMVLVAALVPLVWFLTKRGEKLAAEVAQDHRELLAANELAMREIVERKRAEGELIRRSEELEKAIKQLQNAQQQLMQADRLAAIGQLVSGVAHEVNNPLTAVLGHVQLLLRSNMDEVAKGDLELIYQETQRVCKIVQNLLSFARKHKLERSLASLNEPLQSVLALRAYEMKVGNIEIVEELQPDLPRTMADVQQLQQVFLNIVVNAEQAMAEAHGRGRLLVKTRQVDQSVQVIFSDDGPGIAKENMPRLFEPFFTTKGPGKGTGLGLSICYGIIQEHKGRILVESEEGKGATFIVEIPVVAKAEEVSQLVGDRNA